jgi:chromatin segregation and condensation protein Rec8/ScpA/Scc1 (kleisin family)
MENNNKPMTAVDWLITQLEGEESLVARIVGLKEYNQIVKQAKQMEKEQRGYTEEQAYEFWKAGQEYWKTSGSSITFEELIEQYYNKIYGK